MADEDPLARVGRRGTTPQVNRRGVWVIHSPHLSAQLGPPRVPGWLGLAEKDRIEGFPPTRVCYRGGLCP